MTASLAPVNDALPGVRGGVQSFHEYRIKFSGLTKVEAENVLDWLERNGVTPSIFTYVRGRGFTIEYPSS